MTIPSEHLGICGAALEGHIGVFQDARLLAGGLARHVALPVLNRVRSDVRRGHLGESGLLGLVDQHLVQTPYAAAAYQSPGSHF